MKIPNRVSVFWLTNGSLLLNLIFISTIVQSSSHPSVDVFVLSMLHISHDLAPLPLPAVLYASRVKHCMSKFQPEFFDLLPVFGNCSSVKMREDAIDIPDESVRSTGIIISISAFSKRILRISKILHSPRHGSMRPHKLLP